MQRPLVSVIIPVYRSRRTLARALASVATSGLPPAMVEIVIASDDGTDYRHRLPGGQRFTFTAIGPVRTGPGATRNRAIQVARGEVIAFLDADDTWAPGYLSTLVPLARRHGAAFGRTAVVDGGRVILRMPDKADQLHLSDLGRYGSSFHPVLTRAGLNAFSLHPAQDIRFTAELLARLGGFAPLGRTEYQLRLGATSVTAAAGFSDRVARAYDRHIAEIEQGDGAIPYGMRSEVADVFRRKIELNDSYRRDMVPGESFYRFIARRAEQVMPVDI